MFKVFNAIKDFFGTIISLITTVVSGIITFLRVLLTGVPTLIATLADMPPFMYAGMICTIAICLTLVLVGRKSS